MKALVYKLNIPKYLVSSFLGRILTHRHFAKLGCLKLEDVPMPEIPSNDWVLIKTDVCGICGSDLSLIMGRDSFSMEPYSSFPAVLGHEAVGRIVKIGSKVEGFSNGDRVAVDSILPCVTREIEPICKNCASGDYSLCENFTSGKLSAGPTNGYNASVGGGFGEYFIAHKSQLFRLPENMTADKAVLIDPLASALQPAATHLPADNQTVVVYGGGIIGILLIASIRALGSKARIIAIARHDFQAARAKTAGASDVIRKKLFNEFARLTNAKIMKPPIGKPVFEGGVDLVFDCVGSSQTIDNSLRMLRRRGKLVIVGASGILKKIDSSPVWFKEITVTGSPMYSHINMNGQKVRTYQAALDLISTNKIKIDGLVTHFFDISEFDKAINTALNKSRHKSVKVIFKY